MTPVQGIKIRCDGCGLAGAIMKDGEEFVDPPGWTQRGSKTLCSSCLEKTSSDLHPEVVSAVERLVHALQALMATELSLSPPPGQAITFGPNGMSRRMKRCELLANYADSIMTLYGNTAGFRLASRGAFGHTTLAEVATRCEDLMKAEIAFSEAKANQEPRNPRSLLQAAVYNNYTNYADPDSWGHDLPRQRVGPLYRLREVSRIAQRLARLAATRAGEVGLSPEDRALDEAVDEAEVFGENLFAGRRVMAGGLNPAIDIQREVIMMAQQFMKQQADREARRAAEVETLPSSRLRDNPIFELEHLIDLKKKIVDSGGNTSVLEAIEAKIMVAEARVRVSVQEENVESQVAIEAASKVVKDVGVSEPPPDQGEIAHLRRTIGDERVREAFPVQFAEAVASQPSTTIITKARIEPADPDTSDSTRDNMGAQP